MTFRSLAGADESMQRSEFKALAEGADANDDGMLTKEEFREFAADIGAIASNSANFDEIFDIIADGGDTISINQALAYLGGFAGTDGDWSEEEYDAIVAKLNEGPTPDSPFDEYATDGLFTLVTLTNLFEDSDTDDNDSLSKTEFNALAAELGVNAVTDAVFSSISGADQAMSMAELTGYSNPFGTVANNTTTWTETQFNALVAALGATS